MSKNLSSAGFSAVLKYLYSPLLPRHVALFKLGGWLCEDGCRSSCVLQKMKFSIPVI